MSEVPGGSITVLRCDRSLIATKRWYLSEGVPTAEDYAAMKHFHADVLPLNNIDDLSGLLTEFESERRYMVIRGAPRPEVDLSRRVTRTNDKFDDVPEGLRWALLDIDGVPLPQEVNLTSDPEGAIEHVIASLPEYFRRASCHWQFSSSAGMPGKEARVHLWFWFSRQVTDAELKSWAKKHPDLKIDVSLFQRVQPHYTARPIFGDGIQDPVPRRSGLRRGECDEVDFPAALPVKAIEPPNVRTRSDEFTQRILTVARDTPDRIIEFFVNRGVTDLAESGNGGWLKGCHPSHGSEKSAAFAILPSEACWKDHRTDRGGGLVEYLAEYEGVSGSEAARILREQLRVDASDLAAAKAALEEFVRAVQSNPFDGVRPALEDPSILRQFATVYARDLPAFEASRMRLRDQARVKGKDLDALARAVREESVRVRRSELRVAEPGEVSRGRGVADVLRDAPVSPDAIVPKRYFVAMEDHPRHAGIGRIRTENDGGVVIDPISPTPVVVVGRLRDTSSGAEWLRLGYRRDGQWAYSVVSRAIAANAKTIVSLADFGLSVTSNSAAELVQYIAEYEATNDACLPRAFVTGQIGWQGSLGNKGFLLGRRLLRAGEPELRVEEDSMPPLGAVAFRGADVGDDQIADAFSVAGTFEDWVRAAEIAAPFPRVMLMLYASFVPPLLEILGVPNFSVDLSSQTSTGKTTSVELAAAVWGNPDQAHRASVTGTWQATRVAIERAASIRSGLPLILDDTARARAPQDVGQVLYDVASGRGRARGSKEGMRATLTFRTVLLSTGERPATNFVEKGGAHTRTLTIGGPPFDGSAADVVHEIRTIVFANYGHAGTRYIQHLLEDRDEWDTIRAEYDEILAAYRKLAAASPIANRLASYLAAIDVAGKAAHIALDLPWNWSSPAEALWSKLTSEMHDADRPRAAAAHVISWAVGNEKRFRGRWEFADQTPPPGGWAGLWTMKRPEIIYFLPHVLDETLRHGGFEPEEMKRSWRDLGWLDIDEADRFTTKQRFGDKQERVVALLRDRVEVASVLPAAGNSMVPSGSTES